MKKEDLEQITTSVTAAIIAIRTPREPIEDIITKAIAFHEEDDEHKWIRAQVAKERRKSERWEKLKTSGIFYVFVIVTGAAGTAIWQGIKVLLRKELDVE